jgi:hypothetical protein
MLATHSALVALPIDVGFQVAGQGGDVLESRFLKDSKIATVDDVLAHTACSRHEFTEMRIQLECAAGDIHSLSINGCLEKFQHGLRRLKGNHLIWLGNRYLLKAALSCAFGIPTASTG